MSELGVCVLGAGDMGNAHMTAWSKVAGARLLAVADLLPERRAAAVEKYGVEKQLADINEAISVWGVDVVSVCLPSCLHREASEAAMRLGKAAFCEKPVALTVEDAESMIACREETGATLGIGFCKRHLEQLDTLRELVQSGSLGRPVLYRFTGGAEIRFKPWIMDRREGGGPIIDLCCHYFDQWRWIFGSEPVRVKASGMTFSTGAEELPDVEPQVDTVTLSVEYASGDVGAIGLSWGLPRGTSAPGPEQVLGRDGVVTVKGFNTLVVARKGGEEEVLGDFPGDLYDREIASFADAVRNGTAPVSSAEDGLIALKVSLATLESIETGQAVEVA